MYNSHVPIKFRVWNPRLKQMLYWGFNDYSNEFTGPPVGSGLTILDCGRSDRFTGAKDQNRTPIWENDIILLEYYPEMVKNSPMVPLLKRNLQVMYFETNTHFSCIPIDGGPSGSYSVGFSGSAIKTWRVIGNAHANPELIIAGEVAAKMNLHQTSHG